MSSLNHYICLVGSYKVLNKIDFVTYNYSFRQNCVLHSTCRKLIVNLFTLSSLTFGMVLQTCSPLDNTVTHTSASSCLTFSENVPKRTGTSTLLSSTSLLTVDISSANETTTATSPNSGLFCTKVIRKSIIFCCCVAKA